MKKLLRIAFIVISVLFVLDFVAYRIWFYNPYQDTMHLDPESVFGDEASSNGLFIRNTRSIDRVILRVYVIDPSGQAAADAGN